MLATIAAAIGLTACGSSSGDAPAADDIAATTPIVDSSPEGTSTDGASGERITIGGDEALIWGDGTEAIVLAHGSSFDAASWQAQAVPMAALGNIVVAVENTSSEALDAAIAPRSSTV